jgi:hypothetical protein
MFHRMPQLRHLYGSKNKSAAGSQNVTVTRQHFNARHLRDGLEAGSLNTIKSN